MIGYDNLLVLHSQYPMFYSSPPVESFLYAHCARNLKTRTPRRLEVSEEGMQGGKLSVVPASKPSRVYYDYAAKVWKLTEEYIAFLAECYDGVNVMAELKRMKVWLDCHPRKVNFKAFITRWLNKSQDNSTRFSGARR